MSDLFNTYLDALGHEIRIGESVMCFTAGYQIFGHVTGISTDKRGITKFTVTPDLGYRSIKEIKLKNQYKISANNTYKIELKRAA